MKTPPKSTNPLLHGAFGEREPGTFWIAGLLGRAGTWSRGRRNSEQGPHLWGCDSGAGQGAWGRPSRVSGVASIANPAMEPAPPCNTPACGDATVQARIGTAHDHGAPCPAPRSHPSAKADGASEGGRGAPLGDLTPATRAGAATTRLDQLHGRIPTSGAPAPRCADPCSALRGTWRPLSGHLRHARLANSPNYWLRGSSVNWLATRLAIIPSPS